MLKLKKGRRIKNQFVLNVGDEGAILSHFQDGILANRLFVDSPYSPDVKLIEKLMGTYSRSPVSLLVDVIEQNYSQQVLPPVSAWSVRQQVKRRIARDFQPNDLNSFLPLGRSKEGRRDWNFLFISLANSDPFAKWMEIVLNQKNDFKGVYLLPVEAMLFGKQLETASLSSELGEWRLIVLHNKIGGFRIIAFKNGKLIFTRLAQNMVGDNIPEIVVGNMEQEISNTVEYLKRLAFKGEADSRLTIIAGAEILQKVDSKTLKFGQVELVTPFEAAQKLNLPESVTDKDKFADVVVATHFASIGKHVLKFTSPYTQKLDQFYLGIKAVYAITALAAIAFIGYAGLDALNIKSKLEERELVQAKLTQSNNKLSEVQAKKDKFPKDIDKMLDIMNLSKMLSANKMQEIKLLHQLEPLFGDKYLLNSIAFAGTTTASTTTATPQMPPMAQQQMQMENGPGNSPMAMAGPGGAKKSYPFTLEIGMNFYIAARDQDQMNNISANFLKKVVALFPKTYKVEYSSAPQLQTQSQFEQIVNTDSSGAETNTFVIPAKIRISGAFE